MISPGCLHTHLLDLADRCLPITNSAKTKRASVVGLVAQDFLQSNDAEVHGKYPFRDLSAEPRNIDILY
jgi:hypothetical protein